MKPRNAGRHPIEITPLLTKLIEGGSAVDRPWLVSFLSSTILGY
jgi:hypothetical protein